MAHGACMILGRPLVGPDFAGCHVPVDPGQRMGGGAEADLFSKRTRPVAAVHYRNR